MKTQTKTYNVKLTNSANGKIRTWENQTKSDVMMIVEQFGEENHIFPFPKFDGECYEISCDYVIEISK